MASETFFSQANTNFPDPSDVGEIDLNGFLLASSHLAKFFGVLGTVFTPIEMDISGNVQKLNNFVCEQQPGKVVYVNDIIVLEAQVPKSVAVDALLWLKRALEFTMVFLDGMITDSKNNTVSEEDLRPLCTRAYEETLKNYHGWMVQQIFYLVSRACPWRKDLLTSLALGKPDMEALVLEQMENVLVNLKKNIVIINHLYQTHNLNCTEKV